MIIHRLDLEFGWAKDETFKKELIVTVGGNKEATFFLHTTKRPRYLLSTINVFSICVRGNSLNDNGYASEA